MDERSEIGSALKQARLEKGSSLEEASRRTRVPKKYLEAIEDGRSDDLPAPAYFNGFVKIYCDYLGMAIPKSQANLPAAQERAPAPHLHAALPAGGRGDYRLVMAVSIAVLVCSALWIRHAFLGPGGRASLDESSSALAPAASAAPYKEDLTIIFHGDAWISIVADGKLEFKGDASKGAMQEWKARKTIILRTNNHEAFDLMLNGFPYPLPASNRDQDYVIRAR